MPTTTIDVTELFDCDRGVAVLSGEHAWITLYGSLGVRSMTFVMHVDKMFNGLHNFRKAQDNERR